MGRRVLVAALAASLLLNLAALGWIAWVVAEPAYGSRMPLPRRASRAIRALVASEGRGEQ